MGRPSAKAKEHRLVDPVGYEEEEERETVHGEHATREGHRYKQQRQQVGVPSLCRRR